jgi:calcium/calmodulin-dependent protein kinase I
MGIMHRDIKPGNILCSDPGDVTSVKLVDFGLSIKYDDTCPRYLPNLKCGTVLYMAPEVLNKEAYSKSVDLWSLGITLYNLICKKHPLHKKGDNISKF